MVKKYIKLNTKIVEQFNEREMAIITGGNSGWWEKLVDFITEINVGYCRDVVNNNVAGCACSPK